MPDSDVVQALRDHFPSLSVYCAACGHSRFVHGDEDRHACFFSDCGCVGWVKSHPDPNPPKRHLTAA